MKEKASDNKSQPMKASMLPGSFIEGNREASKASDKAESRLPGSFIVIESGADPEAPAAHDNGPRGDAEHASIESGPGGLGMRTQTGLLESPYHVK